MAVRPDADFFVSLCAGICGSTLNGLSQNEKAEKALSRVGFAAIYK